MSYMVRRYLELNTQLSRWQRSMAARVIPHLGDDGAREFRDRVLWSVIKPGFRVLDVGGGKHPAIPVEMKRDLGLHVVGLDISDTELLQAPAGAYDAIVVGDVASVNIPGEYDLIFSRSVIEHVQDPASAIENLSRALVPGGTMAHFLPCRNAPFAIINRVLGNRAARRLLFTLFPDKRDDCGFQAYYHHCTPSELSDLITGRGLQIVKIIPYYKSDYAAFFAPFYTLEMLRQAVMCYFDLEDLSETFSIVARTRGNRAA